MEMQQIINKKLNEKYVGKILKVLVDGYDKASDYYFGRTEHNAPEIDGYLLFKNKTKKYIDFNNFLNIKVKYFNEYDIFGEVVK